MKWPNLIHSSIDGSNDSSMRMLNYLSITLLLSGVLIVLLFGNSLTDKATIFIWMLACLLTGTAIGFLFGIPKILQNNQVTAPGATTPVYQQQVNTNLTEISDWLTKIIVGLGLVNLNKIPPYLSNIAKILADGLCQPASSALAFACGIIVTYLILGFLFGYIITRLYLSSAFSVADQRALRIIAQKAEETAQKTNEAVGAAQSALQKAEFALIKPSESLRIGGQTSEEELDQLAQTYNQIRTTMSSGNLRTRKMTQVIKEMMTVIPSLTSFDISKALKESDNGKRLAGCAYLYIKPDYRHLEELVDAIIKDPTPFGQYWGIQALGKVLEIDSVDKIDPKIFDKLKIYYDQLDRGIDREYELGKILPELKK